MPLHFPLPRGRGTDYIREASPLLNSPLVFSLLKKEGDIKKRGFAPLGSKVFD